MSTSIGDLFYCARCCQSLPSEAFPSKSGRRVKWKLTDGSLVCSRCVAEHFPDCSEEADSTENSPMAQGCSTPSTTASSRSSPFLSTSNSPPSFHSVSSSPIHVGHGTHAYEVKSQRLKPTKKQLRLAAGGGRVEGNPLFVDLVHWLQDIQALPVSRLNALIEDDSSPPSCRLHSWGLACKGCNYAHSDRTFRLWNHKHRTTKAPSWMRSPPHLPSFIEVPLLDVFKLWTDASEESKSEWARTVQFVTCDGIVIWGRDMGEDGLETLRAFLKDIELSEAEYVSFALPPSALSCDVWPSDIWQRILPFLSVREVARAGIAVLASNEMVAAVDDAWDPYLLMPGLPQTSALGLRSFLALARSAVLASRFFAPLPRSSRIDRAPYVWELDIARSCKPAQCVATSAPARAMSLSKGLLAVAMGSNVKLVRRSDLRSCGNWGLRSSKFISQVALTEEGQTIALAVQDKTVTDFPVKPEVHFYTTADTTEAPRIVQLPCTAEVTSLDFLPHATSDSSVAACGSSLLQMSSETGHIIHTWCDASQATLTACKVGGPHYLVSASHDLVQLWDVRMKERAAHTVVSRSYPTAIGMCNQSSSATSLVTIIGTASGELSRLDWRSASVQACGSLPKSLPIGSLIFTNSTLFSVSAEFMHMGYLGDEYLNIMSSVASEAVVAASSGAWAVAQVHGLRCRADVTILELEGLGSGGFREIQGALVNASTTKKAPKMFRKFEGNPHSQHAGKSGRSNRRRGR